MKIPDRWLDYTALGNRIEGTPFICFKTPLKDGFNQTEYKPNGLKPKDQFTPTTLLRMVEDLGFQMAVVIDLTNTFRYYDGHQEFQRRGVKYLKLKCIGHEVPAESVYREFCNMVSNFLTDNHDSLIGVHCTHGVNRTGYLVCRYMIESLKFYPQNAIDTFSVSRGHDIERCNYIDDLLGRTESPTQETSSPRPIESSYRKRGGSDSVVNHYSVNYRHQYGCRDRRKNREFWPYKRRTWNDGSFDDRRFDTNSRSRKFQQEGTECVSRQGSYYNRPYKYYQRDYYRYDQ